MSADTRERLLAAGVSLVREKSFHAMGLAELLTVTGVPKGSFYHFFESKEVFGVEMIRHYGGEQFEKWKKFLFGLNGVSALDRLLSGFDAKFVEIVECGCRQICLVVKLSAEVANLSEPMRTELVMLHQQAHAMLEKIIREGQAEGSMRSDLDAGAAATFVHQAWLGAAVSSHVELNITILRRTKDAIADYLRPVAARRASS